MLPMRLCFESLFEPVWFWRVERGDRISDGVACYSHDFPVSEVEYDAQNRSVRSASRIEVFDTFNRDSPGSPEPLEHA